MSDELNVWREACVAYGGASIEGAELEPRAAAVIRDYGDERYQQAIADVVKWLREERLSDTADHYAQLITRRFGKDA